MAIPQHVAQRADKYAALLISKDFKLAHEYKDEHEHTRTLLLGNVRVDIKLVEDTRHLVVIHRNDRVVNSERIVLTKRCNKLLAVSRVWELVGRLIGGSFGYASPGAEGLWTHLASVGFIPVMDDTLKVKSYARRITDQMRMQVFIDESANTRVSVRARLAWRDAQSRPDDYKRLSGNISDIALHVKTADVEYRAWAVRLGLWCLCAEQLLAAAQIVTNRTQLSARIPFGDTSYGGVNIICGDTLSAGITLQSTHVEPEVRAVVKLSNIEQNRHAAKLVAALVELTPDLLGYTTRAHKLYRAALNVTANSVAATAAEYFPKEASSCSQENK